MTFIAQQPNLFVPKVFNELRQRYATRPGGYTRVLRIEPLKTDQAPSAILELVDGPKDTRFAMTAKILARHRMEDKPITDITATNVFKVTRYQEDANARLEEMVRKFEHLHTEEEDGQVELPEPKKQEIYPGGLKGVYNDVLKKQREKELDRKKATDPEKRKVFKWGETL